MMGNVASAAQWISISWWISIMLPPVGRSLGVRTVCSADITVLLWVRGRDVIEVWPGPSAEQAVTPRSGSPSHPCVTAAYNFAMSMAAGERRVVSVLVADVVGSTSIAEKLGPERSKYLFDDIVGVM